MGKAIPAILIVQKTPPRLPHASNLGAECRIMDLFGFLFGWVRQEWEAVVDAPRAFVVAILLGAGVAFWFTNASNDREIANLQTTLVSVNERLKLRDDQLADLKAKLALAEEAAKTRGDNESAKEVPPDVVIPEPLETGQYGLDIQVGRPLRLDGLFVTVRNKIGVSIYYELRDFEVNIGSGTIVSFDDEVRRELKPGQMIEFRSPTKFHEGQFTADSFVLRYYVNLFYTLEPVARPYSFHRIWRGMCRFEKGKSDATKCVVDSNSDGPW